jgi:hypothetical protein
MRSKRIRILTVAMALCLLLVAICSCANEAQPKDPKDPQQQQTPDATNPDPDDDTPTVYTADIPAGYNAGGTTFTVYTFPTEVFVWKDYDWQNTGDIISDRINDAVFQRSSQVEEELGLNIEFYCGQSYADPAEFKTACASGDAQFSIGNITMLNHIALVQSGYLMDLNTYGEIALDAPWWDQNIQKDLSILDRNFALTGDIGTMYKRSIAIIIFNKELMRDLGEEDPYGYIETKEWTIEKLIEMSDEVSLDLDSNDTWDENDRYGMIYFSDVICALEIGAGVKYAEIIDGVPELTINSDEAIAVLDLASELLYDKERAYNNTGFTEENMWRMFMGDQALFYYGELHSAEDMRASQSDFGLMPIPLYDEYQESYHHTVNPNVAAVIVVPITNVDETMTSYALDALGAASKNILTPAYYDINLQGVVSRDEESTVTLDLVISTLSYDPGYQYIGEAGAFLRDLVAAQSTAFVSSYTSKESLMQSKIDKIIEAIETKY